MAELNPNVPQVNDPELEVEVIRLLQIVGPLGKLNVIDAVLPTINLGNAVPTEVEVRQPSFRSTDVFSTGLQTNQAANTILADTGPLAAGVFDVMIHGSTNTTTDPASIIAEHRNAANAANLATWDYYCMTGGGNAVVWGPFHFAYEFALNERLRLLQSLAGGAGRTFAAVIFARIRA